MKRTVIVVAGVVCAAASVYGFWHFGIAPNYRETNMLLALGLLLGFGLAAVAFFAWASSDNIYNVQDGEVIAHEFTAAYTIPPTVVQPVYTPPTQGIGGMPGTPMQYTPGYTIPEQHVPDDWAIQLRDRRGRTGWLHFSRDVFGHYPVGSYYTRRPR